MRLIRLEVLHRERGSVYRQVEVPGPVQHDIEVLEDQLDHETGIEVVLDDLFAQIFQRPRVRGASGHHLMHLLQIEPVAPGKRQCLTDAHHVDRAEDLVERLGDLPGADRSDERDPRAHRLEHGLHPIEDLLLAPDHDRQRSFLGTDVATADRCVQKVDSTLLQPSRDVARYIRRDRAHVDERGTRLSFECRAAIAEQDRLDVRRVRHDGDHDILARGTLQRRRGHLRPVRGQFLSLRGRAVVDRHLVASLQQMPGHGSTHDPQPDESDLKTHESSSLPVDESGRSFRLSPAP